MSLNDGFSETFIFWIKQDIFKVVLNFTKGMYTVYAPNGRILVRKEKVSDRELKRIKKQVNDYMMGKVDVIRPYSSFSGFRIA